jgi:hypothetical protein
MPNIIAVAQRLLQMDTYCCDCIGLLSKFDQHIQLLSVGIKVYCSRLPYAACKLLLLPVAASLNPAVARSDRPLEGRIQTHCLVRKIDSSRQQEQQQ